MCNTLELLNSLEHLEILSKLKRKNLIPPKLIFYREIYFKVDAEMRINGGNKTKAVESVSDELRVSTVTIFAALKRMIE